MCGKSGLGWNNEVENGLYCIIHQEALCRKELGMDNIVTTVMKTDYPLHFIWVHGLNLQLFLEETGLKHGDVPHHTVHWLSRSKVFKLFFGLGEAIVLFMQHKGKPLSEMSEPNWMCDFAMLCEVNEHLVQLNQKLQDCKQIITQMSDMINSLLCKFELLIYQVKQDNFAHFSVCQSISPSCPGTFHVLSELPN